MYWIKVKNRKTKRIKNYIDILIKLGRKRLNILESKVGRTHPRVVKCSQWLDKPVLKAQKKQPYQSGLKCCI
ncbi:aspartyl-phosphate phosphatase Spo0E family protein [Desulforamulus ruminis]|uniref:aspartyl-phosphate phosphatase Spo0E family protein n=1 Tax=Desulforamulus ruminis TaxID=1564 RepID=UPI00059DDBEA